MLKIFGDHDKDTQTQAANCIAAGAAEFVLCADGHKGYGFPIGGVGEKRGRWLAQGLPAHR